MTTREYVVEIHDLRCLPTVYEDIITLFRSFEIRRTDRDYHVDDLLALREWEPPPPEVSPAWGGRYTGRLAVCKVTMMLEGHDEEGGVLQEGWVILGIELLYHHTLPVGRKP